MVIGMGVMLEVGWSLFAPRETQNGVGKIVEMNRGRKKGIECMKESREICMARADSSLSRSSKLMATRAG